MRIDFSRELRSKFMWESGAFAFAAVAPSSTHHYTSRFFAISGVSVRKINTKANQLEIFDESQWIYRFGEMNFFFWEKVQTQKH